MKLLGSYPSPFVRRIRMLLHGIPYEFVPLNIFNQEDQKTLAKYGPIAKIPILEDEGRIIWDSLLIAKYLASKGVIDFTLDTDKEKVIIALNEITDSGVILFQLKKFELDTKRENIFSKNHLKRIENILLWLTTSSSIKLGDWGILEQWLYCTLDWFKFRDIFSFEQDFPSLEKFHQLRQQQIEVMQTAPNKVK